MLVLVHHQFDRQERAASDGLREGRCGGLRPCQVHYGERVVAASEDDVVAAGALGGASKRKSMQLMARLDLAFSLMNEAMGVRGVRAKPRFIDAVGHPPTMASASTPNGTSERGQLRRRRSSEDPRAKAEHLPGTQPIWVPADRLGVVAVDDFDFAAHLRRSWDAPVPG